MISLVRNIVFILGKRGELRNKDILLTPQLSSSVRMLEFLSSCVLLFKKLVNYSHILLRVSIDPRVKPEGDERRKSVPEGDRKESVFEGDRKENVPEGDNLYKVMPRLGTNRQAIFELDEKLNNRKIPGIFCAAKNRDDFNVGMTVLKIGRSLEFFATQKIGMTVLMVVFSLFLLFPNVSNSAVYFLPDAQSDEIFSSSPIASIDSVRCEDAGYTYYSSGVCPAYHNQETCVFMDKYLKCDATGWCRDNSYTISSCTSPKIVNTQCPNGLSLYKYCVCPSTYKYACTGTGYSSGNGTVCESKYTKCNCSTNYVWNGSTCVCDSAFKYTCSGTGYSSGSGASCGGKYKSCNCSTYYSWNGSACVHVHSYVCPSGYTTSSAGMISPASASKVCQLSGCSSKSGTCYKETHSHSYSCTSGYSSSCSYGYWGTASKKCSCGATSGTCYSCKSYCEANPCGSGCYTNLSCTYGCASTNSCGGCQSCKACSPYANETGCSDGTESCSDGCGGTRTCCKSHTHSYSCPSGSYASSSSCSYGTSGTVSKVCRCGATSGTCYTCKSAPADPCDGVVCSGRSTCYQGSCCTPDDAPEMPECGCDAWLTIDLGCGMSGRYCRKPAQCTGAVCPGDQIAVQDCCCPRNYTKLSECDCGVGGAVL